ncbi:MAG: hypothetical protein K6E12_04360 [Saccharofermentans sp.]|nr:hypothetical protein [Saccharofermentans sp.]
MSRRAYYIIQALWSIIYSSILWFAFMFTTTVNPVEEGNNTLAFIFLFGGPVLYLVLTIVYIIIGVKKIEDWSFFVLIISIVINIVMGILGFFGAVMLSVFLTRDFGVTPLYGGAPSE